MGLKFRAVAADTGQIGGSASHEFQVLADSGEDAIAWCPHPTTPRTSSSPKRSRSRRRDPLPRSRCRRSHSREGDLQEVAELLALPLSRTIKCIMLAAEVEDGRRASTCC